MPAGAVYVGRPTIYGNPFQLGKEYEVPGVIYNRARAVVAYRDLRADSPLPAEALEELRGKDLVCWCPLDEPCHADVLLEWANG